MTVLRCLRILAVALVLGLMSAGCMMARPPAHNPALATAPFEEQVRAYESADRIYPPPGGNVVVTGDSRVVGWQGSKGEIGPYRILLRGVTGAHIEELMNYVDRLVVPYAPKAVVLHVGEQDLLSDANKTPERWLAELRRLLARIRVRLPETPVHLLSLVPSPARAELWPKMRQINKLTAGLLEERPHVYFVDVSGPLVDAHGVPRAEFFDTEGIRLSPTGYARWAEAVRQSLAQTSPAE